MKFNSVKPTVLTILGVFHNSRDYTWISNFFELYYILNFFELFLNLN